MKKTYPLVRYNSNNSGGRWWLKDEDWIALEKVGWYVLWGGYPWHCHSKYNWTGKRPANVTELCASAEVCPGHRLFESHTEITDENRYMDALAREAWRTGLSMGDAIREWETATGQASTALGCNCCGPPHSFEFEKSETESEYWSPSSPSYGDPFEETE